MRSTASIKGHPIHPALIPFPIAFLLGGAVADLAGLFGRFEALWTIAPYLVAAGIVTAVAAALPGFIDYLFTVPPDSSAKRRATIHMVVNLGAVGIFAFAWLARGPVGMEPNAVTVLLELSGAALLTVGGWLGGTLAFRNQIGVDHRYAEAGKWNETSLNAEPGKPVTVAKSEELAVNQMKLLKVNGRRIVLARTEQGYVAFDDRCSHKGGSLAGGTLICGTVQCPWHGSQFDCATGAVKAGPAEVKITTYEVEERERVVKLKL